jgi:hypothetical protein
VGPGTEVDISVIVEVAIDGHVAEDGSMVWRFDASTLDAEDVLRDAVDDESRALRKNTSRGYCGACGKSYPLAEWEDATMAHRKAELIAQGRRDPDPVPGQLVLAAA